MGLVSRLLFLALFVAAQPAAAEYLGHPPVKKYEKRPSIDRRK